MKRRELVLLDEEVRPELTTLSQTLLSRELRHSDVRKGLHEVSTVISTNKFLNEWVAKLQYECDVFSSLMNKLDTAIDTRACWATYRPATRKDAQKTAEIQA